LSPFSGLGESFFVLLSGLPRPAECLGSLLPGFPTEQCFKRNVRMRRPFTFLRISRVEGFLGRDTGDRSLFILLNRPACSSPRTRPSFFPPSPIMPCPVFPLKIFLRLSTILLLFESLMLPPIRHKVTWYSFTSLARFRVFSATLFSILSFFFPKRSQIFSLCFFLPSGSSSIRKPVRESEPVGPVIFSSDSL